MNNDKIISSIILELEVEIKLLDYLRRENIIDDGMYNYSVYKILNKISTKKNKFYK